MTPALKNWREAVVETDARLSIRIDHGFNIPNEDIEVLIAERRDVIKALVLNEMSEGKHTAQLSHEDILLILNSDDYFTIIRELGIELNDDLIKELQAKCKGVFFSEYQLSKLAIILKRPLPTDVVLKNFELNFNATLNALTNSKTDILKPGSLSIENHMNLFNKIAAKDYKILLKIKAFALDSDLLWTVISEVNRDEFSSSNSRSSTKDELDPLLLASSTGIISPGIKLGLKYGRFPEMVKDANGFKYRNYINQRIVEKNLLQNDNFLFLILLYCTESEIPAHVFLAAKDMLERRLNQEGAYMKIFLQKAFEAYEMLRDIDDSIEDFCEERFEPITPEEAMKAFLSITPEEIPEFTILMKRFRREELEVQFSIPR